MNGLKFFNKYGNYWFKQNIRTEFVYAQLSNSLNSIIYFNVDHYFHYPYCISLYYLFFHIRFENDKLKILYIWNADHIRDSSTDLNLK